MAKGATARDEPAANIAGAGRCAPIVGPRPADKPRDEGLGSRAVGPRALGTLE